MACVLFFWQNVRIMRISEKLVELRTTRGMKQLHVERQAGLSKGLLSKYESGKQRPNEETIKKLAVLFEIAPTEIDPTIGDAPGGTRSLAIVYDDEYPSRAEAI